MDDTYPSNQSIRQDFMNKKMYRKIIEQLHLLNDPLKKLMYLRLFSELSFKEIVDVLGKSENWARVSYYRTKEKIKKRLSEDEK